MQQLRKYCHKYDQSVYYEILYVPDEIKSLYLEDV